MEEKEGEIGRVQHDCTDSFRPGRQAAAEGNNEFG